MLLTSLIMHLEFKLVLVYAVDKSHALKDATTCAASLQLYNTHSIHTTQPNATTLVFESERERMLAVLALSDSNTYTVVCV